MKLEVSVLGVNERKLFRRKSCLTRRRRSSITIAIANELPPWASGRYLDFTAVHPRASPLHYEIVVNVFRTRPRHLVKFQSSRPIVAVRADSGNYRPIKPPLRTPRAAAVAPLRPSTSDTHLPESIHRSALTFRPPLFPASDARQTTRDRNIVSGV